ncbi:MAG TPA: 4Fe-4S binding protein [Dehalococcoidia bacterium]|nr:4Fe-4S binding protein [Dehalococcoidia bacterium]
MSHDAPAGEAARPPAASPAAANPDGYIISSDCMDCGVCEFMCPEGAIFEAKNQFVIRKDACNGCGICVPYCPARAIVARTGFKDRQARTVRQVLGGALGRS